MMEDFNIDDFSEGEELNPSAYNPEDYPTKETVLDFIALNCNKPPVNIDLIELSINGSVKRDPMEMYLQSKCISSSNLKMLLKHRALSIMIGNGFLRRKRSLTFN